MTTDKDEATAGEDSQGSLGSALGGFFGKATGDFGSSGSSGGMFGLSTGDGGSGGMFGLSQGVGNIFGGGKQEEKRSEPFGKASAMAAAEGSGSDGDSDEVNESPRKSLLSPRKVRTQKQEFLSLSLSRALSLKHTHIHTHTHTPTWVIENVNAKGGSGGRGYAQETAGGRG